MIAGVEEEIEAHKFELGSTTETRGRRRAGVRGFGRSAGKSYFEDTLFLVARDPRWLFSYWDFNWSKVSGRRVSAAG